MRERGQRYATAYSSSVRKTANLQQGAKYDCASCDNHAAHFHISVSCKALSGAFSRQNLRVCRISFPRRRFALFEVGAERNRVKMDEQLNMLKFLITLKKNNFAPTREEFLLHAGDYRIYLSDVASVAPIMAPLLRYEGVIIPLNEIDVTNRQYQEVVERVFNGGIPPPSSAFGTYINTLRGDATSSVRVEDAEHMKEDVEHIWESIVTPPALPNEESNKSREARGKTFGLVVGRVQSGKTRSYIGLILKAFDSGWDSVIVLTSNNTALAGQTFERILNSCANAGINGFTTIEFGNGIPNCGWCPGNKYIGIAQKEVHHLSNIEGWLTGITPENRQQMKLLVIDDEADNATPDTQQNSYVVFTDAEMESLARAMSSEDELDHVAQWISGLVGIDVKQRAINVGLVTGAEVEVFVDQLRNRVRQILTRNSLFNFLQTREVALLLDLAREVETERGKIRLGEIISNTMNADARRTNPYTNWRNLRAIVGYVFDVLPSRSRINHNITTLFSCGDCEEANGQHTDRFSFGKMAFVGYTATPYANILNETPELDPLASDFMYPIQTSRHYFGLERIFGIRKERSDKSAKMPIVSTLSAEDLTIIDIIRGECVNTLDEIELNGMSEDLQLSLIEERDDGTRENATYEWKSLRSAIAWLFCAAASRRFQRINIDAEAEKRKLSNRWTTMLFNIGVDQNLHRYQSRILQRYLNWIVRGENRQSFIDECRRLWCSEDSLKAALSRREFSELCSDYGNEVYDYQTWENILPEINWFLDHVGYRVHAVVINATPEGRQNLDSYRDVDGSFQNDNFADDHIWIFCGGHTIARGLTLEGLVVTYFDRVRQTSAVDSLEQMGRWFGYREGYELLPRIWMSTSSVIEFKKMAKIESVMHIELRKNFEKGLSPKVKGQYTRVMYAGRRLSGRDAAMKANDAATGGAHDTYKHFFGNQRQDCLVLLDHFISDTLRVDRQLNRSNEEYHAQGDNGQRFHSYPYWRGIESECILSFLQAYASKQPSKTRRAVAALIKEIQMRSDQKWDVVLSNSESRSRNEDGVLYHLPFCGMDLNVEQTEWTNREMAEREGVVAFDKYNGNLYAFFSGVKTMHIVKTEIEKIRQGLDDGDDVPDGWTTDQVKRVLVDIERNHYMQMLPPVLRRWNWCGENDFSRMSDLDYREAVFTTGKLRNPILQISLIRPSGGAQDGQCEPYVAVSFYWPGHDETRYWWVSAGSDDNEEMDMPWALSSNAIRDEIVALLRTYNFMTKGAIQNELEVKYESDVLKPDTIREALSDGREDYTELKLTDLDRANPVKRHISEHVYYSRLFCRFRGAVVDRIFETMLQEVRGVFYDAGGFLPMPCDDIIFEAFRTDDHRSFHLDVIDSFEDLFIDMIAQNRNLEFQYTQKGGLEGWKIDSEEEDDEEEEVDIDNNEYPVLNNNNEDDDGLVY